MNRLILAAALLGLSAGAVHAQDRGAGHAPRPDPYGDATVSRADAQAKADAQFAELDKDHDGFLSEDEFSAMFPEDSRARMMAPMMMSRIDTNGDSKLSKAEFTGMAMQRFDMADTNHDGQLTKAERDAAREAMRARFRNGGGRGGSGGGDGPPPGGGDGPPPGPGGNDGQ